MARQILTNLFDCSRCGLQNAPGSSHCAACGNPLGGSSSNALPPPIASPVPSAPQTMTPAVAVPAATPVVPVRSPAEWFGWRRRDGTIIHAGLQQMGRLQKEWWESAIKLIVLGTIVIAFGITALVILLVVAILSLLLSRQRSQRPGFIENLATQVASFLIVGQLFGPKKMIPVCDYRIRDAAGVESLVRVEGHVVQGSFAVGDDVTVEGFDHGGTLILRRGWNRRLNCLIRVRRR